MSVVVLPFCLTIDRRMKYGFTWRYESMMNICRWLLIFPACICSWYLMLYLGIGAVNVAKYFCPVEQRLSGWCGAPWFSSVENALLVIFSAASAAVIVLLAFSLAPKYKIRVAVLTLLLGVLVATYMLYETGAWLAYVPAVLGGVLATFLVWRFRAD